MAYRGKKQSHAADIHESWPNKQQDLSIGLSQESFCSYCFVVQKSRQGNWLKGYEYVFFFMVLTASSILGLIRQLLIYFKMGCSYCFVSFYWKSHNENMKSISLNISMFKKNLNME